MAELYPLPAFVILIEDIVPAADTIAVADAPTFILPGVTRASIEPYVRL